MSRRGAGGESGNTVVTVLAVVFMLGGGLVAFLLQTDFGGVDVDRVRFVAADGRLVEGLVHRPRTATALAPAPAALLVHGLPAPADAQSNVALELARRGYVVLSVHQPGYGRSDGPAGAGGYGAADAAGFLRTLLFVDRAAVVLVGHASGGAGVLITAALEDDGYAATVLVGAAPGVRGAPAGDEAFPRNLALVYGQFDEFADELWDVPVPARAGASQRMRHLFGTLQPVQAGELTGSVAEGTGRIWYAPAAINPALPITGAGIAPVLEWVQRTTTAPVPLAPNDQVWVLREAGSGLVWLGFVLSLFGVSGALAQTRTFARMRGRLAPPVGLTGAAWWIAALVVAALPALTYFWARERADELIGVSRWLPQPETTAVVAWLLFNAGGFLVLVLVWYLLVGRGRGARADTLGLEVLGGLRTPLFALLVVAFGHALLALVEAAFEVRARAWLLAQAAPYGDAMPAVAVYALPLVLAFGLWGLGWHALLRPEGSRAEGVDATVANALIATGGLVVLVLVQYAAVLGGQPMPFGEAAATVTALELIVPLAVAAMLSTYLFARTGSVWPGAWVNGLWLAIFLVHTRATVAVI